MTATDTRPELVGAPPVVRKLVAWLETTEVPEGLFAEDVFLDATFPLWRLQASGRNDAIAIRATGHPEPGRVVGLRTCFAIR